MKSDLNKGISSITYDKLNNPSRISYSDGKMIDYDYSADGRKLSTTNITALSPLNPPIFPIIHSSDNSLEQPSLPSAHGSQDSLESTASVVSRLSPLASTIMSNNAYNIRSISTTEYLGNFIFENGRLDKVMFDGGYVKISPTGAWTYHYYFTDHLGSVRVVGDSGGDVEQVNHYYPYGGLIGNLSTNPDKQKYKYNGKEYDTMHGLNTYDYGARQYDGAKIVWDRMDKYCEKYYNINPYVYCAGNPVRFIDPNGMEVRDGVGPYCADNRNIKALAKDLAAHNDPNSIMIVAHGVYENENSRFATSIDIQTYNPSTKEWNHNLISDGKQLDSFLSANSKTWKDYKNGKISAKDLHIVFYSCGSSAVVKEISKDEAFKDVTFIAPNKKVQHLKNTDGSWQTSVENTKWEKREDNYQYPVGGVRDFGSWQTYKNGSSPIMPSSYSGDQNLHPGTKGFDYKHPWF